MNDLIGKKELDGFLYQVYPDHNSLYCAQDQDFESEEQKEDYMRRFYNDEFSFYLCTKSERCACCNQWKEIDALGGIEAEFGMEALEYYIKEFQNG